MNLPDAVCEGFGLRAPRITPVIEGHINESWRVTTAKRDLIVQRINGFVFSNPSVMIANADRAARALRTYWNDPGLEFIETRDGQLALRDAEGNYWRAARYVDHIEVTAHGDPEIAFRAAEAFGRVLTGLATLDVDVVKFDGSVIKDAQKVAKGRAFLKALTRFCRELGVETIGEMVDSPEGLEFVRECGVQYVQGFLFGEPNTNILSFAKMDKNIEKLFGKKTRRQAFG